MNDIYLIMTHSGTIVSKAIKLYTKAKYSHISIGFDENLNSFYSFGRKNPKTPIGGGFVVEGIGKGIFQFCKDATCKVYKITLTDEKYQSLISSINFFIEKQDDYKYNYLGIIAIMFRFKFRRKNYYFCSQFVAELLHKNKIHEFNKDFTLIKPKDFEGIEEAILIYEGKLKDYKNSIDKNYYTYYLKEVVGK